MFAVIGALSLLPPACKEGLVRVAASGPPSAATDRAAPPTASAPWYPSGRNQELTLTWAVYPIISESDGGPRRNLEVIARIGGAVQRVALGPHDGILLASEQSTCNPSLKKANEVSVIKFATMGPETIVARRVRPTLLEISFAREADDEPAKTHGTLATVAIPADARVVDAISEIDGEGQERAIDCSSKAEEPWGPRRARD